MEEKACVQVSAMKAKSKYARISRHLNELGPEWPVLPVRTRSEKEIMHHVQALMEPVNYCENCGNLFMTKYGLDNHDCESLSAETKATKDYAGKNGREEENSEWQVLPVTTYSQKVGMYHSESDAQTEVNEKIPQTYTCGKCGLTFVIENGFTGSHMCPGNFLNNETPIRQEITNFTITSIENGFIGSSVCPSIFRNNETPIRQEITNFPVTTVNMNPNQYLPVVNGVVVPVTSTLSKESSSSQKDSNIHSKSNMDYVNFCLNCQNIFTTGNSTIDLYHGMKVMVTKLCQKCSLKFKTGNRSRKTNHECELEVNKTSLREKCGLTSKTGNKLGKMNRQCEMELNETRLCEKCGLTFITGNELGKRNHQCEMEIDQTRLCEKCGLTFKAENGLTSILCPHIGINREISNTGKDLEKYQATNTVCIANNFILANSNFSAVGSRESCSILQSSDTSHHSGKIQIDSELQIKKKTQTNSNSHSKRTVNVDTDVELLDTDPKSLLSDKRIHDDYTKMVDSADKMRDKDTKVINSDVQTYPKDTKLIQSDKYTHYKGARVFHIDTLTHQDRKVLHSEIHTDGGDTKVMCNDVDNDRKVFLSEKLIHNNDTKTVGSDIEIPDIDTDSDVEILETDHACAEMGDVIVLDDENGVPDNDNTCAEMDNVIVLDDENGEVLDNDNTSADKDDIIVLDDDNTKVPYNATALNADIIELDSDSE